MGIPQQSTVTLRMDPYGTEQGPTIAVLNLKANKRLSLGGSRRLDASFEVFNAANSSAATVLTYLSGPHLDSSPAWCRRAWPASACRSAFRCGEMACLRLWHR